MARRLFISYSHHDADLMGELRAHLRPLERAGVIEPWFDGYLIPGDDFDQRVRQALGESDFIAALVTARFLDSDYCMDVEMEAAICRHQAGTARVVPIIAKPCRWKLTSFSKLLATPTDGQAVTTWSNRDQAWEIVAQAIEKVAAEPTGANGGVPGRPAAKIEEGSVSTMTPTRHAEQQPVAFSIPKSTKPTDQQKDDFRHEAFEVMAAAFETSITALDGGVSGRFRRLDANRFTATLYRDGQKIAGCTVFTGTGHFGANSIAYGGTDSGESNSISENLTVEAGAAGLALKPLMGGYSGEGRNELLTPQEGAAKLWSLFTDRLRC